MRELYGEPVRRLWSSRVMRMPATTFVAQASRTLGVDVERGVPLPDLLSLMLSDMEKADSLYRPTSFWEPGVRAIISDIERRGVESFRRHPSALAFYVPTYARTDRISGALRRVATGRVSRLLERTVGGRDAALADHRLLEAVRLDGDGPWDLGSVTESNVGEPWEQLDVDGRTRSRSMLNYLRGLAGLQRHVDVSAIRTVLEIGGGFGTLGECLSQVTGETLWVDVDIPPVAFVATWYLRQVLGNDAVAGYDQLRDEKVIDLAELRREYRAVVLCSWQLPHLRGHVDLFTNFISFQEMEPDVVSNYAEHVRRLGARHVLLRNSAAGKELATGSSRPGVRDAVLHEHYLDVFPDHDVRLRDATVFGAVEGDFRSELLVLSRKDG